MNMIDNIMALESGELEGIEAAEAMQCVINDGSGWRMQGSWGRSMMQALEDGDCLLGKHPTRDYYGNRIPSRDEVEEGTKGSYDYVVEAHGVEWADRMKAAA